MGTRRDPREINREEGGLCAHWEGFSRVRLWDQSHKIHLILSEGDVIITISEGQKVQRQN